MVADRTSRMIAWLGMDSRRASELIACCSHTDSVSDSGAFPHCLVCDDGRLHFYADASVSDPSTHSSPMNGGERQEERENENGNENEAHT